MSAGEWPVQRVRSLTAAEKRELRAALAARGAHLAELIASVPGSEGSSLGEWKGTVDDLLGRVDELRVEVAS